MKKITIQLLAVAGAMALFTSEARAQATVQLNSHETIAVHGVDGGLMVHVDRPARLEIYTLTGALAHRESLTPGDRFVPLRRGLYIVSVDRTRRKILVQ